MSQTYTDWPRILRRAGISLGLVFAVAVAVIAGLAAWAWQENKTRPVVTDPPAGLLLAVPPPLIEDAPETSTAPAPAPVVAKPEPVAPAPVQQPAPVEQAAPTQQPAPVQQPASEPAARSAPRPSSDPDVYTGPQPDPLAEQSIEAAPIADQPVEALPTEELIKQMQPKPDAAPASSSATPEPPILPASPEAEVQ